MPIPRMSKFTPIVVENESVLLDARISPSLKFCIVVPCPINITKGFDRWLLTAARCPIRFQAALEVIMFSESGKRMIHWAPDLLEKRGQRLCYFTQSAVGSLHGSIIMISNRPDQ